MRRARWAVAAVAFLALLLMLWPHSGAMASTTKDLRVEHSPDKGKVTLDAGGGWYFMRVVGMPIRPVITSGVCVPKLPLGIGTTDTVGFSATVARTITFTSATTDSLLKGGVGARQVKVTWYSGTASDLKGGTITLTGKDIAGTTCSETFTIADNTVGSGLSTNAYSSLTSCVIPVADVARSTCSVSIGRGAGIGLPFTNVLLPPVVMAWNNGTLLTALPADSASGSATALKTCMIKPVVSASQAVAARNYDFLLYIPPYQGTTAKTRW